MKRLSVSAAMLLSLIVAAGASAADEPEVVYTKFHRAMVAGDLDEVQRYAPAAQRRELAAMSPAQKDAQVKMMAALSPRAFVLKHKSVNPGGQGARLIVSGPGPAQPGERGEPLWGTIRMVMEGGEWKVADVEWSNTQPAGLQAPQAAPTPAQKAAGGPAPPKSAAPQVGSMDAAPARKLGTQKPPCIYKPVMTAEDLENCK